MQRLTVQSYNFQKTEKKNNNNNNNNYCKTLSLEQN